MNKKGFTLIELLSVVAIMAILAIVVLPNVTEVFKTAKDKNFVSDAQTIYKTAKNQYVIDSAKGPRNIIYQYGDDTYSGSNVKELDISTRPELKYIVKFNSDGDIYYFYANDGNYQITLGDKNYERGVVPFAQINKNTIEEV